MLVDVFPIPRLDPLPIAAFPGLQLNATATLGARGDDVATPPAPALSGFFAAGSLPLEPSQGELALPAAPRFADIWTELRVWPR